MRAVLVYLVERYAMKKSIILAMALLLTGCSSGENKVNPLDERGILMEQTEESISEFLNRNRAELEFDVFCMLEKDGMTIEVMVDNVSYTFTCSMDGDIIGVGRTDGERFGVKGE